MKNICYNLNDKRVQYLVQTDKRLKRLIMFIGSAELKIEEDGFKCLVKYIIGQQISDKARETLWQRLCSKYNVNPEEILSLNNIELKEVGLSERKVIYIKNLALSIINNEIDFESFSELRNEEIIQKLTALKGIGRWTAEMYLIFSLGRENVLSKGDGTIKRVIMWMYDLDRLPSENDLSEYFKDWLQYETIVSVYCWKSIELGLIQKPFDVTLPKCEDNI